VMRPHGQRKDPQGVPVGRGDGLRLLAVTSEGRENEKEGEKQAEGKVPKDSKEGFHLSFLPSMTSTRYFIPGFVTNSRTPSQHGAHIARTVAHFPVSFSHTENSTARR
jgi:hypothetical protein